VTLVIIVLLISFTSLAALAYFRKGRPGNLLRIPSGGGRPNPNDSPAGPMPQGQR
jgi:hypothetical protein